VRRVRLGPVNRGREIQDNALAAPPAGRGAPDLSGAMIARERFARGGCIKTRRKGVAREEVTLPSAYSNLEPT